MDIYEVVKKLIGSIEPYGDTNIDKERERNINEHILLTYKLVKDLIQVSQYKNRPEQSIKELGWIAYYNLEEIKETIDKEIS